MIKNRIIALVGMLVITTSILTAQNTLTLESTTLTKTELVTGIQIPWEMLWGPDDHIWVNQRNGIILRVDPITGNTTEILDWRSNVVNEDDSGFGSEYGMLGMAFHPDFETNQKIFVVYNYGPPVTERLVSFTWDGTELGNEEIILDNIDGGLFHNGSRILITRDHKILMSTGDIKEAPRSQDIDNLNGKYLRINLDGTVPDDNPIPGNYVYTIGHRNSQGIAYGPHDKIYISEHGEMLFDEINILEEGRNYGWAHVEGSCNTSLEIEFCENNNVMEPIFEWTPCIGPSDIEFYDHPAIPEWQGKMMVAILGGAGFVRQPRISILTFNEDGTDVIDEQIYFEDFGRIRDVCVNPHTGAIYFATNGEAYPGAGPNQIVEYANMDFIDHTEEVGLNSQNISIHPNPASDLITLKSSPELMGTKYEIYSFEGKKVKDGLIDDLNQKLNVADLSQGQYFIRCENELGQVSRTFSIVK